MHQGRIMSKLTNEDYVLGNFVCAIRSLSYLRLSLNTVLTLSIYSMTRDPKGGSVYPGMWGVERVEGGICV